MFLECLCTCVNMYVTDSTCGEICMCLCVCAVSSTGGLSVCHLAAQEDEEAGGGGCFPL